MNRDAQRYAAKIVAETLQLMKYAINSGERNTLVLNNLAEHFMLSKNVQPACKGYRPQFHKKPYEFGTCISINHEVAHGVPDKDKHLLDGDIVGLDIVGMFEGWYADAAITVPVGEITYRTRRLLEWTEKALYKGIDALQTGTQSGDVGHAIQKYARSYGLGIAKYLSGHGIGREIHCSPTIPNIGTLNTGEIIKPGTSICVEPMLTLGSDDTAIADDTWAIVTKDGSLSAHFEHTILIDNNGKPEILTQL
jgi:methionyl aminopeptidase